MTTDLISLLPGEVVEYILEHENITFSDVGRFACTCKHIHQIVKNNNKLWRTKFFQRWPRLREVYQDNIKCDNRIICWREEAQASLNGRLYLLHQLSLMSKKNYRKQELSDSEFKDFDPLFRPEEGAHPAAYYFLVDELINLIELPAMTSNLTYKYYAFKVIRYLKQRYLTEEWRKFINLPAKEQILEKGAVLVTQWSQPERQISYTYISSILNNIAEQTKELLKEQNPAHPIFSISSSKLELWKRTNIDDNQWSTSETRQVMDALCTTLFDRIGFHGNNEMYYSSENSFIDRVLERKHGIPIILAIVFESIARRLGVRCEAVSFPSHFLLRWKERYNTPESEEVESFYIDVFNGGQFLTRNNCPRVGGASRCPIEKYNVHKAATTVGVVSRLANNLEVAARQYTHLNGRAARLRSALELRHMVQPQDTNTILQLGRFYMLHQMDLADLVRILQNIQKDSDPILREQANLISQMLQMFEKHSKPEQDVRPKNRKPEVQYAIGMIMRHKTHGYSCVITGWDCRCEASSEWMSEMHVDELERGPYQPFYNVLVDDGSAGYAAQENLYPAPEPTWVNHDEIGRYFCKFTGTYYVPNEEKAREYPEDAEMRDKLLAT